MFCVVERDLARYQAQVDREAERELFVERCVSDLVAGDEVYIGDEWDGTTIEPSDVFAEIDAEVWDKVGSLMLSSRLIEARGALEDSFKSAATELVEGALD